ncbi:unnamed protein product [Rotaria socialis]
MAKDLSYSNTSTMATPTIKQSKVHLSQSQMDFNRLRLSFYPPTFTSYDQKRFFRHLMPEDILDDSKISTHQDDMIRHVANGNNKTSGHLYRDMSKKGQYRRCHQHHPRRLLRTVIHP